MLLGLSAGLIKASIAPLMAGQCPPDRVVRLPPARGLASGDAAGGGEGDGGEWAVECQDMTIARTMGLYYASINVGAFVALGSVWAEARLGFWAAFALPGAIFCLMPPVLWLVRPRLVPEPAPSASALGRVWAVLRSAPPPPEPPLPETPGRERQEETHRLGRDSDSDSGSETEDAEDGWDFAEDTALAPHPSSPASPMNAPEADPDADIRTALKACALFAWFAVYNVAPGLNSATISLAGAMRPTLPNDALDKMNPLAVIVAVPVLNWMYPRLEARGIRLGPVRRVVVGFGLTSLGERPVFREAADPRHGVPRPRPGGRVRDEPVRQPRDRLRAQGAAVQPPRCPRPAPAGRVRGAGRGLGHAARLHHVSA